MKKYHALLFLALTIILLLATSQAFASPANNFNMQKTPGANTPGARATEKATDNGTQRDVNPHGKHENFRGIINAIDSTSITLTLRDGSSVIVSLNADTRMKFIGPKDSRPASLQPGMNAM